MLHFYIQKQLSVKTKGLWTSNPCEVTFWIIHQLQSLITKELSRNLFCSPEQLLFSSSQQTGEISGLTAMCKKVNSNLPFYFYIWMNFPMVSFFIWFFLPEIPKHITYTLTAAAPLRKSSISPYFGHCIVVSTDLGSICALQSLWTIIPRMFYTSLVKWTVKVMISRT